MYRAVSSVISNMGQFEIFWGMVIEEGFPYPMVEFQRWVCSGACPAVSTLDCLVYFSFTISSVVTLMYDINFVSL